MDSSPTHITEAERQKIIREGVATAWRNIPDSDRQTAITFYMNYAYTHQEFTGGDVLAAWRETDDPVAQEVWRNRWGAMGRNMSGWGVVEKIGKVTPKNKQSHGDTENLWKSMVYRGD